MTPLFDGLIRETLELTAGARPLKLGSWPDAGRRNLVLQSEMAFELGPGRMPAVSLFAAAPDDAVLEGDSLRLLGPDLSEMRKSGPYARIALLRVKPEVWTEENALYASLTRLKNARYSVSPRGYMPRVDSSADREPVRVSARALNEGLTVSGVAGCYRDAYRRYPEALGVTQIFVTDPEFDYAALERVSASCAGVIKALDHILKDFKMDCDTCKLKAVCAEVEGLRELHFKK